MTAKDLQDYQTLLTALDRALEIGTEYVEAQGGAGTWGVSADLITLKHLQEYAASVRKQLNEAIEADKSIHRELGKQGR